MTANAWRALGLALALALPGAAHAEDACVVDARKLCPDLPYGGGAVLQCLRDHWWDVSSACQQVVQGIDSRARQLGIDCSNDIFRYCATVPVGKGRVLSCLTRRWDDLASNCRDGVARLGEKIETFKAACSADAARLCQAIEPGEGRIFACLKFQERAVSSRCAAALKI